MTTLELIELNKYMIENYNMIKKLKESGLSNDLIQKMIDEQDKQNAINTKTEYCFWKDVSYWIETDCGNEINSDIFNVVEDIRYCPYCGKEIKYGNNFRNL